MAGKGQEDFELQALETLVVVSSLVTLLVAVIVVLAFMFGVREGTVYMNMLYSLGLFYVWCVATVLLVLRYPCKGIVSRWRNIIQNIVWLGVYILLGVATPLYIIACLWLPK